MPFNGQSPFLRRNQLCHRQWIFMCQCPSTGNPHFYTPVIGGRVPLRVGVNALQRAIPISTSPFPGAMKTSWQCVNALQRAIPISTVPSQNPHKQGVSEAISAGNSQKILKQSIFRAFFWLVLILPLICYKFITSIVPLQLPTAFSGGFETPAIIKTS